MWHQRLKSKLSRILFLLTFQPSMFCKLSVKVVHVRVRIPVHDRVYDYFVFLSMSLWAYLCLFMSLSLSFYFPVHVRCVSFPVCLSPCPFVSLSCSFVSLSMSVCDVSLSLSVSMFPVVNVVPLSVSVYVTELCLCSCVKFAMLFSSSSTVVAVVVVVRVTRKCIIRFLIRKFRFSFSRKYKTLFRENFIPFCKEKHVKAPALEGRYHKIFVLVFKVVNSS
jgi:hypothetical protein